MSSINQLSERSVADVMTAKVVSVMADDTISDVSKLMLDYSLSTIPVINSTNQCIGIISRKDMTELYLKEDQELAHLVDADRLSLEWFSRATETSDVCKVHELMSVDVVTVAQSANLPAACQMMASQQIHHLPVVNDDDELVGMISTFDVVKAISEIG